MKMAIGADHGGFEIKEHVKKLLAESGAAVEDFGCTDTSSVDYPDFASMVAGAVGSGSADQGVLVCTAGIGMSIAANKFPGVRAALCLNPDMAEKARTHNNANILVLPGKVLGKDEIAAIVKAWHQHPFTDNGRHARRIRKISIIEQQQRDADAIAAQDPEIYAAINAEIRRQADYLNLIASENTCSRAVRQAQGSVMTNKYAEGYPAKRYYNGCDYVDDAESMAIDRAKELFGAEHANVQPHCGSSANMAVYFAALEPGDTIMAMSLDHGGHLTHGHKVNFSGRLYNIVSYGVDKTTGQLNYDELDKLAMESKPRMIVAGASAYARTLDFARFRAIADKVDALLMVDMAHIAGLIAGGVHPSPVPFADFVTTTTHKTLRGPRSGMVLCREKYAKDIDRTVFPGLQGGPLMHVIAAKAVCFREALSPAFKQYARQIVENAAAMADELQKRGYSLVSGGTDTHLMLVDLTPQGLTGKTAAAALDKAGIIVNKNTIPFDTQSPFVTSGIRIGTPTVTSRGMGTDEMRQIAGFIADALEHADDEDFLEATRKRVITLTAQFPGDIAE